MKNKLFFWIALLLISVGTIAAVDDEILVGKKIVEDQVPCGQLSDEQLESVGEYIMETMHPGEAHELMHRMMGIEEGTERHEEFHKAIAERHYCNRGYSGMMGGTTMGGMMSGGYGSMMGGYGLFGGLFGLLIWLLVIGLVVVVFLLIIKLWKDVGRRR